MLTRVYTHLFTHKIKATFLRSYEKSSRRKEGKLVARLLIPRRRAIGQSGPATSPTCSGTFCCISFGTHMFWNVLFHSFWNPRVPERSASFFLKPTYSGTFRIILFRTNMSCNALLYYFWNPHVPERSAAFLLEATCPVTFCFIIFGTHMFQNVPLHSFWEPTCPVTFCFILFGTQMFRNVPLHSFTMFRRCPFCCCGWTHLVPLPPVDPFHSVWINSLHITR